MSYVGADDFGRFFSQSGTTITFGDGTNGKMPPSGANIRVPNVIISMVDTPTADSYAYYYSSNLTPGACNLSICQFSKFNFKAGYSRALGLSYVGFHRGISLSNIIAQVSMSHVGIAPAGVDLNVRALEILSCEKVVGTHIHAWAQEGQGLYLQQDADAEFTDCFFARSTISTTTSSECIWSANGSNVLKIHDSTIVGASNLGGKIDFHNIIEAQNLRLVENNTGTAAQTILNATTGRITNLTVPPGGGFYGDALYCSGLSVVDMEISGWVINSARNQYLLNAVGNSNSALMKRLVLKDIYVAGVVTSIFYRFISFFNSKELTLQNIRSNDYTKSIAFRAVKAVYKGIPGQVSGLSTQTNTPDNVFMECYDSATTGFLAVLFGPVSEFYAGNVELTGGAYFSGSGRLYLPTTGDTATYTWPHKILGVSGFRNLAPVFDGGYLNINKEYSLDGGAWKTLTAANLSAETVSATAGFNFKIRFTATADSANNYLNKCAVYTTVDQTVIYPDNVTITLTPNVSIAGAEIRIYDMDNNPVGSLGSEIAGVESAGATFSFSSTAGNAVWIQIMQEGYEEYGLAYTVGSQDTNLLVILTAEKNQ